MNAHHRPGCGFSPDHDGICRSVRNKPTDEAARYASDRARQRVILMSRDAQTREIAELFQLAAYRDPYAALVAATMSNEPIANIRTVDYARTLLNNHGFTFEETS